MGTAAAAAATPLLLDVNLHHLVCWLQARVGERHRDGQDAARAARDGEVGVGEGGVREAIAEAVERRRAGQLVAEVPVRAARAARDVEVGDGPDER